MAREWDGANGYYSLGSPASLDNLAQGAMTVSCHLYPQTTGEGGTGRIVNKRNVTVGTADGGGGWIFFTDGTASLGFQTISSAPAALASQRGAANQITLNAWSRVALTYNDAGDRKGHIYVNGTEISYSTDTAGGAAPGDESSGDMVIGNNTDQTRTFDGYMAELAIWNIVQPAEVLAALAAGVSPAAFPRNRVLYVPMIRDVIDLHGNAITASGTHNVIDHPRVWAAYGRGRTSATAPAAGADLSASLVDGAAAADAASAGAIIAANITEPAASSDLQSAFTILAAQVGEGVSVADLQLATMIASAAATEAAAASDTASTATLYAGGVTEGAATSDALTAAATMVAQVLEAGGVVEQLAAAQQLVALLTEAAAGVDVTGGSQFVAFDVTRTELVAALDVLVAAIDAATMLPSASPLGRVLSKVTRRPNLSTRIRG